MNESLRTLADKLRNGDWNLRAPQELADMIAAELDAISASGEAASALRSSGEAVAWRYRDGVRPGLPWFVCDDPNRVEQMRVDGGYDIEPLYPHPATPASAWRPIAEAPRDGSMFLCWVSAVRYGEDDDGRPYESDVSAMDFCEWRDMGDGDGFWMPYASPHGDGELVTHWMLPTPPPALDADPFVDGNGVIRSGILPDAPAAEQGVTDEEYMAELANDPKLDGWAPEPTRRTVARPEARGVEGMVSWPKWLHDRCLEALEKVETQFAATGSRSAAVSETLMLARGLKVTTAPSGVRVDDAMVERAIRDWLVPLELGDDRYLIPQIEIARIVAALAGKDGAK